MKTLAQIKSHQSKTLDGRDASRLCAFLTEPEIKEMGFALKEGVIHTPEEFTKENILAHLKSDVEFGFEKALNQRGLSAGAMFEVVQMWNWILEDGLENFSDDNYAQYGLPLFKATALKYGFPNPIGDDAGDEHKYSSGY